MSVMKTKTAKLKKLSLTIAVVAFLVLPLSAFAQNGALFSLTEAPPTSERGDADSQFTLKDSFRDQFPFTAKLVKLSSGQWRYEVSGLAPNPNYQLDVSVREGEVAAYVSQTSGSAPQIQTRLRQSGQFELSRGLSRQDISFRVVDDQPDEQSGDDSDDLAASDQPIDLELEPRRTERGVGVRGEWEPHPDATGYEKEVFRQDIHGQATNITQIKGDPTKLGSGLFSNLAEDDGYCYYFQVTVYPLLNGERIDGAFDTADLCVMQNPENEPGTHPSEYEDKKAIPHDRPEVSTTTPIDPPEQPHPRLPEDGSGPLSSQLQDVLDRVQELEQLVDYLLQSQAN